jgi:hypothetical protein
MAEPPPRCEGAGWARAQVGSAQAGVERGDSPPGALDPIGRAGRAEERAGAVASPLGVDRTVGEHSLRAASPQAPQSSATPSPTIATRRLHDRSKMSSECRPSHFGIARS